MSRNNEENQNNGDDVSSSPSIAFRKSILTSIVGASGLEPMEAAEPAAGNTSLGDSSKSTIYSGSGNHTGGTLLQSSPLRQLKPSTSDSSGGTVQSLRSHNSSTFPARPTGKPLIRRRSSLFDSLPSTTTMTQQQPVMKRAGSVSTQSTQEGNKSLLSFVQKLSQESTLMGDDACPPSNLLADNGNRQSNEEMSMSTANTIKKSGRKSSLFGAVMKRFGSTSASEMGASHPSTPTRKSSYGSTSTFGGLGNAAPSMMSPTGNSVMNIVNKFVMNSPFRFQSPQRKRRLNVSSSYNNNKKSLSQYSSSPHSNHSNLSAVGTPSPAKKRRKLDLEEHTNQSSSLSRSSLHDHEMWEEATISNEKQINFVDWSLKSKARIECHPAECFWQYRQTQKWKDGLKYWQFKCTNDGTPTTTTNLPPLRRSSSLLSRDNTSTLMGSSKMMTMMDPPKSKMGPQSKLAGGETTQLHRPQDPATQILQSINAIRRDISSNAPASERRKWQDAFQSVYLKYCKRIQSSTSSTTVATDVLECNFYSIGIDHVVLFSLEAITESPFYIPRVIISTCCPSVLEELQKYGANPIMLAEKAPTIGQEEQLLSPSPVASKTKHSPMSPTLKADLEALRQAQAFGTNAGADVHVKLRRKSSKTKDLDPEQKNRPTPPLSLKGMDDVSLFFEFYLNQFGCITAAATDDDNPTASISGLPILVSCDLGPFLHATQSSLTVNPAAKDYPTNGGNDDVANTTGDAVEVEGTILPGTVRKLMVSLASYMTETKARDERNHSLLGCTNNNNGELMGDSDGAHGSHYVVFHSIEDEASPLAPRTSHSSRFTASAIFNGWQKHSDDDIDNGTSNHRVKECSGGRAIQLMVWDISRSNVVACKLEAVSLPRPALLR